MSSSELQPHELMQAVAEFCETNAVPYRVVGSMASMLYGEPRFTNDVDIVAELLPEHVPVLAAAFPPPEYYLSESAVRDAIERRFQFNILHPASGLKADIIVPPDTDFSRSEASRVRRIRSEGEFAVWFGSPEDVILKKLEFFREGGSEKHLRDIVGILKVQSEEIELAYLAEWVTRLKLAAEWAMVENRTKNG